MKRFGTFEGVFTPSLLSILGVIMYLRLGWVVGSVGLGKALIIIIFANLITLATALSMSSVVTNIRIGAGGAHSIIAKSLGIEAGGAIGIPLYLSQAIAGAFYIVGFTECWRSVFPGHYPLAVSLTTWLVILIVSYLSARLAFRLQYGIMALIGLSIISILFSNAEVQNPLILSSSSGSGMFWMVFAIFFPAVTGILAGAAMSGELKDPKRSIPLGTLSAIAVSFTIYIFLAVWIARHIHPGELIANTSILIDLGRWKWAVIAGIMGATLSSALSMFVGSPRTLFALGKHSIVPFSSSFAQMNKKGEPSSAILFTSLIALMTLLYGTLDSVANLLTMSFLVTYGIINLSVFIEQSIGIVSFRPSFRVPRIIPLFGGISCIAIMFLINFKFSIIAIITISFIYWFLLRRQMAFYSPDVRSGILVFVAEQLAKAAARLPYHPKIWKPNLLVAVKNLGDLPDLTDFLRDIVLPSGRLTVFDVLEGQSSIPFINKGVLQKHTQGEVSLKESLREELSLAVQSLKEEGIFVASTVIESSDFITGAHGVIQTLKGTFFPPNTLFLILTEDYKKDAMVETIIKKAEDEGLGVIVLERHPKVGFGERKVVNLWIRRQSPNIDLSILIALQLKNNWDGQVCIIQVVDEPNEEQEARSYLIRLKELMRMPIDTQIKVFAGNFKDILKGAPPADINIFGMPLEPDIATTREIFNTVQTSVLFLRDSEHERATA